MFHKTEGNDADNISEKIDYTQNHRGLCNMCHHHSVLNINEMVFEFEFVQHIDSQTHSADVTEIDFYSIMCSRMTFLCSIMFA